MRKKAYILIRDLIVFGFIIYVVLWSSNVSSSISELKHAQDSANARNKYVIDFHFGDCDFTPNEKFKPFGN